jgi:hypothetical protein
MHAALPYRGFLIYHDGHEYVVEPQNVPNEVEIFEIGGQSVDRLMRMIDELLLALEGYKGTGASQTPLPTWYQAWLDSGSNERISTNIPIPEVLSHTMSRNFDYRMIKSGESNSNKTIGADLSHTRGRIEDMIIKSSLVLTGCSDVMNVRKAMYKFHGSMVFQGNPHKDLKISNITIG